jgi:hypothetical protein
MQQNDIDEYEKFRVSERPHLNKKYGEGQGDWAGQARAVISDLFTGLPFESD